MNFLDSEIEPNKKSATYVYHLDHFDNSHQRSYRQVTKWQENDRNNKKDEEQTNHDSISNYLNRWD